ncbi:DUF3298 and DUF4163 domain-containing protein [Caldibacillus lycopersici]|uniref:DUF3298 and DUF4163 domain-containing protein n=1 Tax=Perspicuibacillus lycopersici TaxID=1325689 RepID=A0AAE3LSR5_9BACI|nr:DUF3298 and DUF4163 domain-containing protein [Perspicuibacillus lycopersici]MCU9613033.1 DUF3298 and DUF4163 domain-containing protein [Perspicuibacillus lycopersici]
MNKKLEALKKEYKDVPIPKELDEIIAKSLPKKKKHRYVWPLGVAAAAMLFTTAVNVSPEAAQAMAKIPFVKEIVEVITFHEVKEEKNNTSIDVRTPAISGLENKVLEDSLNEKYIEESKKLYEEFEAAGENDRLAIEGDYEVVTETPILLSIRQTIQKTQVSGYMQHHYVTIDKENEALLTLKSLFKNDQYVKVISENIKQQMQQQMDEDPNKSYFLTKQDVEPFTQIDPNQEFYITTDNQLVISFDEYEVAPGYMGVVEFKIPTDILSEILVGDRYIN